MFFRRKKKPECEHKCDHEWFELESVRELVDISTFIYPDFEFVNFSHIFCPKCSKRLKVRQTEWKRTEKAQRIKREYNIRSLREMQTNGKV